jgi:hypothetical protein
MLNAVNDAPVRRRATLALNGNDDIARPPLSNMKARAPYLASADVIKNKTLNGLLFWKAVLNQPHFWAPELDKS